MARHYPSNPRVRAVIERLAELVLEAGSVNAVAELLSERSGEDGEVRIYPNRVHGLLSGDPTRSVNTATLEAIEEAVERVWPPAGDSTEIRSRIQQAFVAELSGTTDIDHAASRVAEELELPLGVVLLVADTGAVRTPADRASQASEPDWSWQDEAVDRCLRSLRKGPNHKVGLIVPTGGGKTRISLRIILRWLATSDRDDSVVLWVTHRTHLRRQARRALQRILGEGDLAPEVASSLFADRINFVMLGNLSETLAEFGDRVDLIVVDEAHHAAAPSYQPIFDDVVAPGLFLTATPNRADDLPIGIDEIAYTVPYRQLLERGCVVEPVFESPVDMFGLEWGSQEGLRELADYLLERTESDFRKVLVAVSKRERAEELHAAVAGLLEARPHHPLSVDDVAYVHGGGTSGPGTPSDFLDEFAARPRGVLVSTSQLIGEGFDDPLLDSAVITYPSSSMAHLMQVAGRALRYAPDKKRAFVVQVRESALEYHFEQRWLYQDISDALRPDLIDLSYSSRDDLITKLSALLATHHVADGVRERITHELEAIDIGAEIQVMLTGIPYYRTSGEFTSDAQWGAILVGPSERSRFVHIFNNISDRSDDLKEHATYLERFVSPDTRASSLWKSYVDLVAAMEYSRRELTRIPYAGEAVRNYRSSRGSTWLRYVTFVFDPTVPAALEAFLTDAINRTDIIAEYLESQTEWGSAARIELPLSGSYAYLLSDAQAEWLTSARLELIDQLRDLPPDRAFDEIAAWRGTLVSVPIPLRLVDEIAQLIRPERFGERYLNLREPL